MNNVKKTIGWADYTWNPITGCLHGKDICPVSDQCYARAITKRFGINNNFKPTLHRDRLEEPAKIKTKSRIFVGSMGDMWGDWVEYKDLATVLEACFNAVWHNYLFLTKNPQGYIEYYNNKNNVRKFKNSKFFMGFTDCGQIKIKDIQQLRQTIPYHILFVSLEPFMGWRKEIIDLVDWVIVGGWSGGKKHIKDHNDFYSLLDYCIKQGKPFYLKDNLNSITNENLDRITYKGISVKQFPWEWWMKFWEII